MIDRGEVYDDDGTTCHWDAGSRRWGLRGVERPGACRQARSGVGTREGFRVALPAGTTQRQQRADALVAMCVDGPDVTGTGAEIVVHVVSYSAGGTATLDNLQCLCGPHDRAEYAMEGSPDR